MVISSAIFSAPLEVSECVEDSLNTLAGLILKSTKIWS